MIIELKGVGFENKGAHLMMLAIIAKLKGRWPRAKLVFSGEAACDQRACSVSGLRKISMRKNRLDLTFLSYLIPMYLRRYFQRLGFVTEADIDLIVDASGFSYSDQWAPDLRLWHLRNELLRFKKFGKAYIFLPQSFGPFLDKKNCAYIVESFFHAAMICAREDESVTNIEEHTGKLSNLVKYGDFTNLMPPSSHYPRTNTLTGEMACVIPNHNMLSNRNAEKKWLSRYETLVIEMINYFRLRDLTPFFLNHEGKRDADIIDRINRQLSEPIRVITEHDPLAVKGLIGSSRIVFCSRYHGCISALSQGIPCIATSWSHKYDVLYREYDVPELLLASDATKEQLFLIIDECLDLHNTFEKRLLEKANEFEKQTDDMWEKFFQIVEGYDADGAAL